MAALQIMASGDSSLTDITIYSENKCCYPQLASALLSGPGWGWNCRDVSADRASQRLMLARKMLAGKNMCPNKKSLEGVCDGLLFHY